MAGPADPWIYHITHVTNLAGMVADGGLWSDAGRRMHRPTAVNIGYQHIKARRMQRSVTAGPRGKLGEYVPFYFCPRSVMLYVISKGASDYAGGQREIVHLASRVSVITQGTGWAFTDRHAEVGHAEYFDDLVHLTKIQWEAVEAQTWVRCKEEKQAEFLIKDFCPWDKIRFIGVQDAALVPEVDRILEAATSKPRVEPRPHWYYT